MPLNIDGAGRSRTLACLPAARGTVAPTRGQVPVGVLLGTSKVTTLNLIIEVLAAAGWFFLAWIPGGSGGSSASSASEFWDQGA